MRPIQKTSPALESGANNLRRNIHTQTTCIERKSLIIYWRTLQVGSTTMAQTWKIEAVREIVEEGTAAEIQGVFCDLFSASAIVQVSRSDDTCQ